MSLEVTGRLHTVFPTQQIKDNFSKREFVIEITEESPSGMVFTNYASFQLVNQSCTMVDPYSQGDLIRVNFNIRGNRWERDGQVKYITNLNAWRISPATVGAAPQQPAAPSYGQPMQQQPAYQAPPPSQGGFNAPSDAPDDLPF